MIEEDVLHCKIAHEALPTANHAVSHFSASNDIFWTDAQESIAPLPLPMLTS